MTGQKLTVDELAAMIDVNNVSIKTLQEETKLHEGGSPVVLNGFVITALTAANECLEGRMNTLKAEAKATPPA